MRSILLLIAITLSGCASIRGGWRLAIGTSGGAALGAGSGALLSPNSESRALNALVFGLGGALVGGGIAWLTDPSPKTPKATPLKEKDLGLNPDTKQRAVIPVGDLPPYLKSRLSPVVIEEATERDAVSEDGTLHEPHKVYRIVKPAELFSSPEGEGVQK